MRKEIRVSKGRSNEKFALLTETRHTKVIVGGQLTLSVEDARGLYNLTSMKKDEDDRILQGDTCRVMLRDLAKRILFTTGEATSAEDLVDVFRTPEQEEVNPFDEPISARVQKVVDKM